METKRKKEKADLVEIGSSEIFTMYHSEFQYGFHLSIEAEELSCLIFYCKQIIIPYKLFSYWLTSITSLEAPYIND